MKMFQSRALFQPTLWSKKASQFDKLSRKIRPQIRCGFSLLETLVVSYSFR